MAQGGIPKTIKIGDVEYIVAEHPELLTLIENTRKEEKDKLYGNIETLKKEVETFKNSFTSAEKKEKDYKDQLSAKEAELKKAQEDLKKFEGIDPTNSPKNDGEKMSKEFEEKLAKIQEEADKKQKEAAERIAKLEADHKAEKLAEYRERKLAEHKDKIIGDFVPENLTTNEEIDASVTAALAKSKKYIRSEYTKADGTKVTGTLEEIEAWEEEAKKNPANPASPTYVPPTVPPAGGGGQGAEPVLKDVKDMSPEAFKQNREALRAQARQIGLDGAKED